MSPRNDWDEAGPFPGWVDFGPATAESSFPSEDLYPSENLYPEGD